MLETFTIDTFAPLTGETFRLHVEGAEPIDVVLERVTEHPPPGWGPEDAAKHRTPFSLAFLGPATFVLPQAMYRFEHEGLGTFEMFIVPISRTAQAVSYEAVFS